MSPERPGGCPLRREVHGARPVHAGGHHELPAARRGPCGETPRGGDARRHRRRPAGGEDGAQHLSAGALHGPQAAALQERGDDTEATVVGLGSRGSLGLGASLEAKVS